jgi:hypothetical protein
MVSVEVLSVAKRIFSENKGGGLEFTFPFYSETSLLKIELHHVIIHPVWADGNILFLLNFKS